MIALSKALKDAEDANKAFTERKKAYQDANMEAIDRVLKAQAAGRKLTGKDGQIQAEWEKWQAETGAEAKKVSAARTALADARPVAELSLTSGNGETPPIEQLERQPGVEGHQRRRDRARPRRRNSTEKPGRHHDTRRREGCQRRAQRQVDRHAGEAGVAHCRILN